MFYKGIQFYSYILLKYWTAGRLPFAILNTKYLPDNFIRKEGCLIIGDNKSSSRQLGMTQQMKLSKVIWASLGLFDYWLFINNTLKYA